MIVSSGQKNLQKAVDIIHDCGVIGMPTETVYGLAGSAISDIAAERIYSMKKRPRNNPLISHYAKGEDVHRDAVVPSFAEGLIEKFWPGPLTLILNKRKDCRISNLATCNMNTVAVRVPSHPIASSLLELAGVPLIAPSANLSGKLSPTSAHHVRLLSQDLMIIDGGKCQGGLESTILDVTGATPTILRRGATTREVLESTLEMEVSEIRQSCDESMIVKAPGMLHRHYSPNCELKINVTQNAEKGRNEGLLAFGETQLKGYKHILNLSPSSDLVEASKNLFSFLHLMNEKCLDSISIVPIPDIGIGCAINDRIERAANKT